MLFLFAVIVANDRVRNIGKLITACKIHLPQSPWAISVEKWLHVNKKYKSNEIMISDKCGDSPVIFTGDAVTTEHHKRITTRVINKSLFIATHMLSYFVHVLTWKLWKLSPNHHFTIIVLMALSIVVLWRHANMYWDAISTDCPHYVSKGDHAFSRRRQVNYHSLIIRFRFTSLSPASL